MLGRGADVCEKGEGGLAQIGKVRVKAPFATAVDVGGGRDKKSPGSRVFVGHCDVRWGRCLREGGRRASA